MLCLNRAAAAAEKKQLGQAVAHAQEARQYVDDSETRRLLAALLFQADRNEESAQLLRYEAKRAPNDRELRENLAHVLYSWAADLAKANRLGQALPPVAQVRAHV